MRCNSQGYTLKRIKRFGKYTGEVKLYRCDRGNINVQYKADSKTYKRSCSSKNSECVWKGKIEDLKLNDLRLDEIVKNGKITDNDKIEILATYINENKDKENLKPVIKYLFGEYEDDFLDNFAYVDYDLEGISCMPSELTLRNNAKNYCETLAKKCGVDINIDTIKSKLGEQCKVDDYTELYFDLALEAILGEKTDLLDMNKECIEDELEAE